LAKSKNKKVNKITKQLFGIVLLSLAICFSFYIIYVIINLFTNPTDNFIIKKDLLTAEESTVGYIIREEKVIETKSYENGIVKIKDEGEKVAKGENIFRYYTENEDEINAQIQDIDKQVQVALDGQNNLFPTDIKSLDNQIEEKLKNIIGGNNVQEIAEHKKDINTYISKKAKIAGELSPAGSYINDLIKQRSLLEQELYDSTEYVVAESSGVVSYRIDGLENILTPSGFENLSKEYLEEFKVKTGQLIASNENSVKIVNNFECYIVIISNSKEAENAKEGDKIYLKMSNLQKVKAKVEYIKEESGSRLFILKITEGVENLINYRKISVDIVWWEKEGLKAPKSAIIYENGLSYIVKTISGVSRKILVKVEQENDKYCIIRNYKTSELEKMGYTVEEINKMKQVNIYDEILVSPSIEEL